MLILTIRTDSPQAEIGLFQDQTQLAYEVWEAHRALAAQLHSKVEALLTSHAKQLTDVQGIVCFAGPGSFTGLRIGLTVGDALSYAFDIPIVGMQNPAWIEQGIERLAKSENDRIALPYYGAPVHITAPKK